MGGRTSFDTLVGRSIKSGTFAAPPIETLYVHGSGVFEALCACTDLGDRNTPTSLKATFDTWRVEVSYHPDSTTVCIRIPMPLSPDAILWMYDLEDIEQCIDNHDHL